jgi:hypothetical protein
MSSVTNTTTSSGSVSATWIFGKTEPITKYYKLGKTLGQPGQFGFAQVVTPLAGGPDRAVKVISKSRFMQGSAQRTIRVFNDFR